MTDGLTNNLDETVSGEVSSETLVGQAASAVEITAPANGETKNVILEKGQTASLNFDAAAATPSLEGGNFVLSFDVDGDGSADSRIVFEDLVQAAQGEEAPVLVIGGVEFSAGLLIGQAQALASGETLETAAGAGTGPQGGGGSTYNDDFGDLLDGLASQGALGGSLAELIAGLDGDQDTVFNDAPIALPNDPALADDGELSEGNLGGVGDNVSANLAGIFGHDYGNDGTGSLLLTGAELPEGFTSAVSADGLILIISQDGVDVLQVSLADATSGRYEVELLAAVKHPEGDDENNVDFTIEYRVTDNDGDFADGTLNLSVDDDTPVAFDDTLTVSDEGAGNAVAGTLLDNGDNFGADSDGVVREVTHDGVTYTLASNGQSVLSSGPADYNFDPVTGVLTVSTAGNATFIVDMAGQNAGDYTYEGPTNHSGEDFALGGGSFDGGTYTQTNPATGITLTVTGNGTQNDTPVDVLVAAVGDGLGVSNVPQGVGDTNFIDNGTVRESLTFTFSNDAGQVSTDYVAFELLGIGTDTQFDPEAVAWVAETAEGTITGTSVVGESGFTVNAVGITSITISPTSPGSGFAVGKVSTAPDTMEEVFSYTIEDADGDQASATLSVTILDDNPTASITLADEVQVILDETDNDDDDDDEGGLLASVTVEASDLFTNESVFGGDGASTESSVQYDLSLDGRHPMNSGLDDAVTDEDIILTQEPGGDIIGSSATGGEVFRISVNQETGDLTVTQSRAIEHNDPNDHDEETSPEILGGLLFSDSFIELIATVTDADGDQSTDSIILNNLIKFEDDGPVVDSTQNALAQLDDDVFGGNAGGEGDISPDTANLTGVLDFYAGVDGVESVLLTGADLPDGFTSNVSSDGTVLTITQTVGLDGTASDVLTVTLDDTTSGNYTVAQLAAIAHPDDVANGENNLDFTANYQVTDGDGDTADGTLDINVDDDSPVVDSTKNNLVQLDDDALGGNAGGVSDDADSVDVTGSLNFSAGADGVESVLLTGAVLPAGFTSSVSPDGTVLTITQTIGLDGTATDVLTVTLDDTTSGDYTVAQIAAIAHPDDVENAENNLDFTANYQVTDRDGDTADGTLAISVDDDSPVAQSDLIRIDETSGRQGGTDEIRIRNLPDDFPDLVDGRPLSASKERLSFDFGADQEGGVIALTDADGNEFDGLPSGLTDSATDLQIFLYNDGSDTVIGKVGGENGEIAFVAYLPHETSSEHASLYFVQYRGVEHPKTNRHDEDINMDTLFYTITDGDGDTSTANLRVNIDDDGPRARFEYAGEIEEETLVDEVDDNSFVDGKLRIDFGSDGGKVSGISFLGWVDAEDYDPAGSTLYSNDQPVVFAPASVVGANLVYIGSIGSDEIIRIEINQTSGDYTIKLSGPVDHPDISLDANSNDYDPIDLGFRYTITDNDGDRASNVLVVTIEDDEIDSRSVRAHEGNRSDWKVIDEATLDDGVADNSSVSGVLEFGFGADGGYLDDIYFEETKDTEHDDEAPEDTLTSGGDDVAFDSAVNDGAGNMVLVGKNSVSGEEVIVVTINKTSGAYTVELKAPIDNEDTGSGNDNGDPLTIGFRYVTYDNDGDQDISRLEIVIEDDLPTVAESVSNSTDESSLPGAWATASGTIVADFGADGGEFTDISLDGFTDAAGNPIDLADLSSGGHEITTRQKIAVNGDQESIVLIGYADGSPVFDIYLDKATGEYDYRQFGPLDHKGDKNIGDSLKLVFGYEVTDGDDDTDQGKLTIEVSDSEIAAVLDEDHSFNGATVSGNLLANDTLGADGASVISYTYAGKTYDVSGALIINGVGQFYLKPDGSYKFYPEGNPDQDKQVEFGYTIKDADGDEASSKLVIDIEDAVPTAGEEYAGHIRESEIDDGTAKLTGTLDGDFGDDGAGSFEIADLQLVVDADYGDGAEVALTSNGQPVTFGAPVEVGGLMVITGVAAIGEDDADAPVLTLSVNPATGRYEIELLAAIDHPDATRTDLSDQVELTFKVIVTDGEGDTADGSVRFRISDDGPVVVADSNGAIAAGDGLGEARGNVLDNDLAGADGGAWVNSVTFGDTEITLTKENTSSQEIAGIYGTLFISSEGRYRYEPFDDAGILPDGPVVDEFSYTITDNDGDVSEAVSLSVEVKGLVTTGTELYQASGWNAPGEKAVAVDTAADKTVTVRDYVEASVDYSAHADEEIILSVQNAKRGDITLGDKDDILVVTNTTNGAGSTTYPAEFKINAGDGNDTVFINDGEARSGAPHTTNATIVDGSLTTVIADLGDGDDVYENQTEATDIVTGGVGNDLIDAGNGNDILYGNEGDDIIDGGSDSDVIFGGDDNDILEGGNGNDILYGDEGVDEVNGGNGNDILFGGIGNDEVSGGNDNDILHGDEGEDELSGGNGNDYLYGDEDKDGLSGGNGNDQLYGGTGNDLLDGGNDLDILIGGTGNDILSGGGDVDTFVFSMSGSDADSIFGQDVVTDFNSAEDVLRFTDVIDTGSAGLDIDDLNAMISNVTDNGENGSVVVDFHNGSSITFDNMGTVGSTINSIDDLVNDPSTQIIID